MKPLSRADVENIRDRDKRTVTSGEIRQLAESWLHLHNLVQIATELAGHITRPIALSMPFDRDVLRHWANKYHEARRSPQRSEKK